MKRGQKGTDKMRAQALKMRQAGATLKAVAEKFKITILTASRWTSQARSPCDGVVTAQPDTDSLARWIAFGLKYKLIQL